MITEDLKKDVDIFSKRNKDLEASRAQRELELLSLQKENINLGEKNRLLQITNHQLMQENTSLKKDLDDVIGDKQ